jgi:hypothetical protein
MGIPRRAFRSRFQGSTGWLVHCLEGGYGAAPEGLRVFE